MTLVSSFRNNSGLITSASLFCILQNPPLLPSVVLFCVLPQTIIFLIFLLLFDLSNIFLVLFTSLFVSSYFDHRVLLPFIAELFSSWRALLLLLQSTLAASYQARWDEKLRDHIVSLSFSCFGLVFSLLSSFTSFMTVLDPSAQPLQPAHFLILHPFTGMLLLHHFAEFFHLHLGSAEFSVRRPSTGFVEVILHRDLSRHRGIEKSHSLDMTGWAQVEPTIWALHQSTSNLSSLLLKPRLEFDLGMSVRERMCRPVFFFVFPKCSLSS